MVEGEEVDVVCVGFEKFFILVGFEFEFVVVEGEEG